MSVRIRTTDACVNPDVIDRDLHENSALRGVRGFRRLRLV
jgi:hypothetical protein